MGSELFFNCKVFYCNMLVDGPNGTSSGSYYDQSIPSVEDEVLFCFVLACIFVGVLLLIVLFIKSSKNMDKKVDDKVDFSSVSD